MFLQSSDFPFTKVLEENVDIIRSEFLALKPDWFMPWPYYEVKDWSVFGLIFHLKEYIENQKLCPRTMEILRSLPVKLTTAGFSRLGPYGMISPHPGDTDCEYTFHLGLQVPDRSFLKSGDEIQMYRENKVTAFDDMEIHLAWNEHNKTRVNLQLRCLKQGMEFKLREISDRMLNVMHFKNRRYWRERASLSANARV